MTEGVITMDFENELSDLESEVISLFNEAVSSDVDELFIYIYNRKYAWYADDRFRIGDRIVEAAEAGLSEKKRGGYTVDHRQ